MQDWEIGYLAGMVDAECHVGIQREMSARRKTPAYIVRFELAMTDKKPIDFVNSLLPTAKVIYCAARNRRVPYYRLRVTQQEALELLRMVLPYVQGKRRQIEICLEIDALRRACTPSKQHNGHAHFQRMPEDFASKADVLFAEFRSLQLNKRKHS